jgi:hypothetical protein
MILNSVLYGILGASLTFMGIGLLDKPIEFILILALVMLINLNARVGR